MEFIDVECSPAVRDKLHAKHGVEEGEVHEALFGHTHLRRGRGGLYQVYGRTDAGRYLFVAIRDLGRGQVRVVTARDMTIQERRRYGRR
jgi:uncharacterized DUF497 family protein